MCTPTPALGGPAVDGGASAGDVPRFPEPHQASISLPDFLQRECDYLRTRLAVNIDETSTVERYAITVTGALWAWIGANPHMAMGPLRWLPLALAMCFGFRALAIYARIRTIHVQLGQLEVAANVPVHLRWAPSLETRGSRGRLYSASLLWTGINLVNMVLALLAPRML